MASAPETNGTSPPAQTTDSAPPISEPLDASTLDVDPDVSAAGQDVSAGESMTCSASNRPDENTQGKTDSDTRQEALDLTMEEARLPLRKDTSMREFLNKMDDYAPVIPDAVTFHALTLAGLKPPPLSSLHAAQQQQQQQQQASSSTTNLTTGQADPVAASGAESDYVPLRLARLISLATQKFIADIATDAYQYSRMRTGVLTSNSLSAIVNPGAAAAAAAGPSGAGAGGGGGAGGAGGGAGAGGAAGGAAGKSGANAHMLGVPRAGFGGGGQGGGQNRAVLTLEDLGMSVGEYGVNIKRGEFYR